MTTQLPAERGTRGRSMAQRPVLVLLVVLVAATTAAAAPAPGKQAAAPPAFLADQLPLRVLVTTPPELADRESSAPSSSGDGALTLSGRQAITAVFSRPVIALGADWGAPQPPADKTPFNITCSGGAAPPGRLRWATTAIARWDPAVDWPPELTCTFTWNAGLRGYDGAPLQLRDAPRSTRLATPPLGVSVERVESAAAAAATGGQWSAFLGVEGDRLPEVPPDGNVTLAFTYPVSLQLLAKALKLAGPGAGGRKLALAPCWSPAGGPVQPAGASSRADALAGNSTCVVARIVPGLDAGASAVLRLPKGARFSALGGALAKDLDVEVFGLRPFRIPLRTDFANITSPNEPILSGASYRRLAMWLPHGLAKDTPLPALKAAMRLCALADPLAALATPAELERAACTDADFQVSRPAPALLLMRVPALQPRQRYLLRVRGAAGVKDAFGLPLQPSADVWWAADLEPAFTGPAVQRVALLEPAATQQQQRLEWPWVSRGVSRDPKAPDPLQQVRAWSVPVGPSASGGGGGSSMALERALASVTSGWGGSGGGAAGALGGAGTALSRPNAYWPTFQSLALPGQPGVTYLGSCCTAVAWPTPRDVLSNPALVVQSDLQAAFVEQAGQLLAWVTTAVGGSAPVRGARVQVYLANYNSVRCSLLSARGQASFRARAPLQEAATPGPSCTTGADGTCSVDVTAAAPQQKQQPGAGAKQLPPISPETAVRSAVVTADGHGALVVPSLPYSGGIRRQRGRAADYAAALVLDRALVKPGDDLHVTAYIQQRAGSELREPDGLAQVVLQVSPGLAPGGGAAGRGAPPTRIVVDVDQQFGSVHVVLPVPKDAPPGSYSLQLALPGDGADGSGGGAPLQPLAASNAPLALAPAPLTEPTVAPGSGDGAPAPGDARPAAAAEPLPEPEPEDDASSSADGAGPNSQRRLQQQQRSSEPEPTVLVEPGIAVEANDAVVPPPRPQVLPPQPGAPVRPSRPPPLGATLAVATFTVADPRPPTASLELNSSSPWVKPDGSLVASVAARSYVGSDVAGANITVAWSTARASGELALTTDARGAASGRIDLGRLPPANRSEAGGDDVLTLRASWVGPTRELVTQSTTVKIADGPLRVELSRTLLTDVPGVAFGVSAAAFKQDGDSPVEGTIIDVSLVPRNGSASLAACSEAARAAVAAQRCSIKAGDPAAPAACQLRLPCAGEFQLRGCVSGGGGCSRALRLGRNASTWAAAPWSSGPGLLNLLADRANVSEGSNLTLATTNPFWGPTSGLLVWGDGEAREQRVLPEVPPGPVTIRMVDLGPECRAGCKVALILASARPGAGGANASGGGGAAGRQRQAPAIEVRRRGALWPLGPRAADRAIGSQQQHAGGGWGGWLGSLRGGTSERGAAGSAAAAPGGGDGGRSAAVLPDVPRSKLYDPLAPVTASAEVHLGSAGDAGLRVSLSVAGQSKDAGSGAAVVSPQSRSGSVGVDVRDVAGTPVAGAQVTLLVVDRAVLDQRPYALQDVGAAMAPPMAAAFGVTHLNELRVGRDAINATFATLRRRLLSVDPFLPVDAQVTPARDAWHADGFAPAGGDGAWSPPPPPVAAVDVPDDRYLAGFTTPLTPLPARVCGWADAGCTPSGGLGAGVGMLLSEADALSGPVAAVAKPAPVPMLARSFKAGAAEGVAAAAPSNAAAAADAAPGAPGAGAPRLQQDFRVTVLFTTLTTGADGRASVALPAPDNVGRFSVRAYVAAAPGAPAASKRGGDKNRADDQARLTYGAAESSLLVRRPVSLLPSLPRQARVGDAFQAGVLVEAPGAGRGVTVAVTASLQHAGGGAPKVLRMSGPKTATVLLTPSKPQAEVRFSFHAESIGVGNVTFKADVVDGGGDGEPAGDSGLPRRLLRRLQQLLAPGAPGRNASSAPASAQAVQGGSAGGRAADQLQLQLPVLGKQSAVTVATSFALRANGSSGGGKWQEGLALPSAERGSGSVDLIAGVGSLPAIQATYSALARQGLEGAVGCASGAQAVALSVLPQLLALYEAPAAAAQLNGSVAALTTAAASAAAGRLTTRRLGLLPQDPGCVAAFGGGGPQRADIPLNAWAAWLVQQALGAGGGQGGGGGAGGDGSAGALAAARGSLEGAAATWRGALQTQLVADAAAARRGAGQPAAAFADLEALSWARLALGPGWEPAAGGGQQAGDKAAADAVRGDLSVQRLTAAALAGNLTVGGQARVGLTLLQDPATRAAAHDGGGQGESAAAAAVRKLAKRLSGAMRVGGRTAYVATGDGKRAAAGLADQALALAFLVEAAPDGADALVQKLAGWVSQGAAPPPLAFAALAPGGSPWEGALRGAALTAFDASTSSTAPDVRLVAAAAPRGAPPDGRQTVRLLAANFTPANAGRLVAASTPWRDLPANASLVLSAAGAGEVSVAASLNFTPAELLPFPTYRGLWVQSALALEPPARGAKGGAAAAVAAGVGLGQLVTLTAQVTSADDQADVVLEVLMPGGLEPLDPNVARDADAGTLCGVGPDEDGGVAPLPALARYADHIHAPVAAPWSPRLAWPVCPAQATSPEVVRFRYGYLAAGTHSVRFRALAATPGAWLVPPVKAFVAGQPEVMGLSPAGSLAICGTPAGGCAAKGGKAPPAAPAQAKGCPGNCNGNGACNLATGVCICATGFSGPGCGVFGGAA